MRMSIGDWGAKIKGFAASLLERDIFIALVFTLAVLSSFALGRLSAEDLARAPVRILEPSGRAGGAASVAAASQPAVRTEMAVSASRKGTVYYHAWCSGGNRIAAANKISFATAGEAEAAGYRLAKGCPGL